MFKKLKNKKGFTLVELIVVLVILAILAALLVPALTGYIDKANNEKIIATTRQIVMAAQTEVSEQYGKTVLADSTITIENNGTADTTTETNVTGANIVKLAEVGSYGSKYTLNNAITKIVVTYTKAGHVTTVAVTQNGKTCTYYETEAAATTATTDGKTREGNYVIG